MRNPIIKRPLFLLLYVVWWMLPGSIHFYFMYQTAAMSISLTLIDSIISFVIFAILGLPIWYMVRYGGFETTNKNNLIRNQLISMAFIFIIWIGSSYLAIYLISSSYVNVFINSLLWRSLIFLPVYLILLAMYYLVSSMQILKDQEIQKAHLEMLIKEAELNALKSQINPHFLFNSLNSATALTVTNPEAAREMIIKISDFFRFNLLAGKKQFVTLKQEIEQSLLYLEIEKERFGEKILVNCQLPKSLETKELPALLLQPIVENCVKHGVYESTNAVKIDFYFRLEETFYEIKIANDIDKNVGSNKKGTGLGLKNISDRLALIYNRESLLKIENSETKFVVTIKIPTS